MVRSEKETESAKSKDSKPLLDAEFGKEFLTSWKSLSVAEDDTMDFGFETVGKGKKKAFNFDKLDVDFGLDCDFDKLSSFKVHMPDLDFSSPTKKTAEVKDRKEGKSPAGNHERTKKGFSFSFDFNELDSFNFDSAFSKQDQTEKKVLESERKSPEINEHQGSQILLPEAVAAFEDDVHVTENSLMEHIGTVGRKTDTSMPSTNPRVDDYAPKSTAAGNAVQDQAFALRIISITAQESDQKGYLSEKALPSESHAPPRVDTTSNSVPDVTRKDCPIFKKADATLVEEKNIGEEMAAEASYDCKNLLSAGPTLPHVSGSASKTSDRDMSLVDTLSSGKDVNDAVQCDANLFDSASNFSSEVLPDSEVAPLVREPEVGKVPAIFKCKESGQICSKVFNRWEDDRSHSLQEPSVERQLTEIGTARLVPANTNDTMKGDNGKNKEIGRKLVSGLKPVSREHTKSQLTLTGGQMDVKSSTLLSSPCKTISLTEMSTKPSVKICANLQSVIPIKVSLKDSGTGDVGVETINSAKSVRAGCDLTSLKFMRATKAKEEFASSPTKENSSARNSKKLTELRRDLAARPVHQGKNKESETLLTLSLKRKSYEESNVNSILSSPLKRSSQSPTEKRNFKESSGRAATEQVHSQEKSQQNETDSCADNHLMIGLTSKVSLKVGTAVDIDNGGNVEKAEAYSGELENINSMLKKQQEEAKELLVRALVNNNKLLMLDHPIYAEKCKSLLCNSCPRSFRCEYSRCMREGLSVSLSVELI